MVTLDRFSGDNPAAWVLQAEQYFAFYNIFPKYQVSIASLYLDGEALDWYRWLFRNQQLAGWDNFVDKLLIRFPNRIREALDLQEAGSEILRQLAELRDALSACATKLPVNSADQRGVALPVEAEEVVASEIDSDLDKGNSSPEVISEVPIAMLETPIGNSSSSIPFNSLVVSIGCIETLDTQLKVTTDEEVISSNNVATLFEKSPQKGIVATTEGLHYCVEEVFDISFHRHKTKFARQLAIEELFLVPFVPTISYQVPIMHPLCDLSVNFDGGCYSIFIDKFASGYRFKIGVPCRAEDVIICSMVEFLDISFSDHHILHHFPFDPGATHFLSGGTWMVHFVREFSFQKQGELLTMKNLRHYLPLLYDFAQTFGHGTYFWWQHKWNFAPTSKNFVQKAREGISYLWLMEVDVRDPIKLGTMPANGKIIGDMLRGAFARTSDSRTQLQEPIVIMLHMDDTTWVNAQAGPLLKIRFHFPHSNAPFESLLVPFASEASVMPNRIARLHGTTYSFDPEQLNATSTPRGSCDLPNFHFVVHNLLPNVILLDFHNSTSAFKPCNLLIDKVLYSHRGHSTDILRKLNLVSSCILEGNKFTSIMTICANLDDGENKEISYVTTTPDVKSFDSLLGHRVKAALIFSPCTMQYFHTLRTIWDPGVDGWAVCWSDPHKEIIYTPLAEVHKCRGKEKCEIVCTSMEMYQGALASIVRELSLVALQYLGKSSSQNRMDLKEVVCIIYQLLSASTFSNPKEDFMEFLLQISKGLLLTPAGNFYHVVAGIVETSSTLSSAKVVVNVVSIKGLLVYFFERIDHGDNKDTIVTVVVLDTQLSYRKFSVMVWLLLYPNLEDKVLIQGGGIVMNGSDGSKQIEVLGLGSRLHLGQKSKKPNTKLLDYHWDPEFKNLSDWYTYLLKRSPTGTINIHVLGNTITANPENVEYILKTNFDNFPKGKPFASILGDLLGRGIFAVDGELWKLQRKIASLELGSISVRSYAFDIVRVEIHDRLIPLMENKIDENTVLDLQDIFRRFSFDSICKFSFGMDPGCLKLSLPVSKFQVAFDVASKLSAERALMTSNLVWKIKRALSIGSEKHLKKAIKLVNILADDMVRQKRESGFSSKNDLLSRFMRNINDDNLLRDIVISFLLAGRDTIAASLVSFFWLLAQNPQVRDAIRAESSRIMGEKEVIASLEQIRQMHYLTAAVHESLRLFPPVQFDSKFCQQDDTLPDGTFVTKGTRVTYHPYAMGRMEKIWGQDCLQFKPERWLQNGIFVPHSPFKYPVFQAGLRVCLGKDLALLEMKTVVLALVRHFDIKVVADNKTPQFMPGLTATLRDGLPVIVKRRLQLH